MIGCLFIHGFTGSPWEVEPLVDYLREHTNWTIACPVLPGHEEGGSLKGVSYTEWLEAASKALDELRRRCDTIYLIGFSMGGMIASALTANQSIDKLVLLSPAVFYYSPKQLSVEVRGLWQEMLQGKLKDNALYIRYHAKIKHTPLSAAMQFRKLVREYRPRLQDISVPVFLAHGLQDGIVPYKSTQYIYETVSSEEKAAVWLDECHHLICHCENNHWLFEQVYEFLCK